MKRTTYIFTVILVLCALVPFYAHATFLSAPDVGTLGPNGQVSAIVATSSGVYLGGGFTYVGTNIGGFASTATSTGIISTSSPIVNGTLSVVIPDGSGGWYIGGTFTQVGTSTRNNLAHILSNNTVDPNFNPNVGSTVLALALSTTTSTLYTGGQFTTVGGVTYNYLAAINTTNGNASTTFNPNMNFFVYTLALTPDGSTLYAGGGFSSVGGVTYNGLAAIKTSNGTASTTFNPNMGSGSTIYTITLSSDGSLLYTGGFFGKVGGVTYNNLAAISTATASATPAFNPNMQSSVYTLLLSSDGSTLYAGGQFNKVGGVTYNNLAAISTVTASATPAFNPNLNGTVYSIALSSDGSTLYTGGQFSKVGGVTYNDLAAINTTSASATPAFSPNMSSIVKTLALSSDGSQIYFGSNVAIFINGATRNGLAALDSTGKILNNSFNPNVTGGSVFALAISPDGSTLYAGGNFTTVGGVTYNRLAAINTSNGTASTTFNPNLSSTVNALAISSDGSLLYTGGVFTTVGGVTYNRLAAINTTTASATPAFNPNMSSTVSALVLTPDGSTLYAGGQFTTVGGVTYNRLAAINTTTASATPAFNPNVNFTVSALALSSDNSTLYTGGSFSAVGGVTYNDLAAINTTNGNASTTFNPNLNNIMYALALSSDNSTLYTGGAFTTVGGVTYNRLAAINTTTASATPAFNPNMSGAVYALALSPDKSKLYAGGVFTTVGGNLYNDFALFSNLSSPLLTTSAPSAVSTSSLTLNANISYTGSASITDSGFAYGTSSSLTTGTATTSVGSQAGAGNFNLNISGLTASTTYYFRAYAVNSQGTSTGVILSTSTLPITVPSAPTSPVATAGNTIASITFTSPTTDGGTFITGYTVISNPAGGTDTNSGTTVLTHIITGLTNGTPYTFTVVATNAIGTSSASTVSNSVTPSTNASVSTNALGNITQTGVTLNGSILSTGGSNATDSGFAWGTSPTLGAGTATTSTGAQIGAVSFATTLSNLTANTTYYFRAYAVNGNGTTTGSIISFTTLAVPAPLTTVSNSSSGGTISSAALASLLAPGPATTAYLNSLRHFTTIISVPSTQSFTRNLTLGMTGSDVKVLQTFLNTHGFTVTSTGPGSVGKETNRFGYATKAALIKFQKANGIPTTGYFGIITRGKLDML